MIGTPEDESVLVQLVRLDGKLDRITDKVVEVRINSDRNQIDIGALKSLTQTLQEGAAASKETAVALALALKDAKETQEATARAEIAKSNKTWSPYAKVITVIVAMVSVIALFYQVLI